MYILMLLSMSMLGRTCVEVWTPWLKPTQKLEPKNYFENTWLVRIEGVLDLKCEKYAL